ncbi:TPA: restriction endonuclease subunit S [Klebsiella quasipneumoniae subsp. similipneumoniae]|nr:restriction endonuclease subunit S [Enterobacter hormaechei]QHP12373.1 restriction endonuclease subunit S [Klebsiella pneumoniae]RXP18003.1 restriction endonuclease subunit S [Escherichia coli]HBW1557887.1 restriction endonuclease subunit S [Klebsiella quasipneumoniae subsp. similipneumoniae]RTP28237.1 restriction endonuclease subunit S [Enterobacter hormaechei]
MAEAASNAVPVGYKQTDIGVIPEDWDVSPLSRMTSLMTNGFVGTAKTHYTDSDDGVTYIQGYNVEENSFNFNGIKRVTPEFHKKNSKSCLREGDVLMVQTGDVGLVTIVPQDLEGANCHALIISRFKKETYDPQYFSYYLNSQKGRSRLKELETGTTMKHINVGDLLHFEVPYPRAKHEQTVIANALSDVDALISELEKLIAKKQAIKTATMQQLLTGRARLPQFALRDDGTPKGTKPSELGEIPEDWEVKTYGEVFTFLSTSTNSRADLSEDGDFGYVHYGDIHTEWNNKLDLNKERLPRISKNIVSSAFVMDGDLIMADASEDYEGIGKTVEVFNVGDKQLVAGLHTFLLRDKEKVLADGFRGYLHSIPAVKSSFDRLATGMKVYGISKNNLSSVCIPVPSLEEQISIATILSDMDAEIQALEQRLGKTHQIKQGMMQELLTGKTRLIKPSKEVIHE